MRVWHSLEYYLKRLLNLCIFYIITIYTSNVSLKLRLFKKSKEKINLKLLELMQVHLNTITPRWKKLKELNKTVRRSIIPKMRDEWIFARSLPGKVGITVQFLLPLCKLRVLDTWWLLLFMTVLCNMAISTRCETCYIAKFGCLSL